MSTDSADTSGSHGLSHDLSKLGYALLFLATLVLLHQAQGHHAVWAVVALGLLAAGYAASEAKEWADPARKEAVADAAWCLRVAYYVAAVLFALPLQWYDALGMLGLLVPAGAGAELMLAYYVVSGGSYLAHPTSSVNILQGAGRALMVASMTV